MDKSGIIGEISENLGGVVKQAVKQTVKAPVDLTKTAGAQIMGNDSPATSSDLQQIEKMMGQGATQGQKKPQNTAVADPSGKKLEEEKTMEEVRRQLHSVYYQNLTNPGKAPQESVIEKLEKEKAQEEQKLMEDNSKKPQPLPATVKQGTGEKLVGVSG